MKKIIILVLIAAAFASCATIISGSRQSVIFSAPSGTKLYVDGVKVAEIPEGYDSVSTKLDRSLNGLDMVAKKDGYRDTHFRVKSSVNGVVFINIILGGIIGGAVDLATGAAAKFPNYIEVELQPL